MMRLLIIGTTGRCYRSPFTWAFSGLITWSTTRRPKALFYPYQHHELGLSKSSSTLFRSHLAAYRNEHPRYIGEAPAHRGFVSTSAIDAPEAT